MSSLALVLVLCSALLHAIWNLLAKRASGGMVFVWVFSLLASLLYLPLMIGILVVSQPQIGITEIAFLAGSSALHIAYYFLLNRGYRVGDLSLVYP
ncbi:MAG: EamA family transporter, partial [Anaerolineae bacterium]|nr:EamA family transporter [Anaerolineae bacterium]